jgi:DnaJ-class molecular chaperone
MNECDVCAGTGLVAVKSQYRVCTGCGGSGYFEAPSIEPTEPVEEAQDKDTAPEPPPEERGFLSRLFS